MASLIGTAGHVDHGKTSLIRALTGIDADRLPEEKARGLTIDIGFAVIDLPNAGRASVVDVPGHERLVHNMLVGAMGMDVVLLCVSAVEGVMPQTREHVEIIEFLPVRQMVIALTQADRAGDDDLEIARLQIEELLDGTRFASSPMIPCSALMNTGLEEIVQSLDTAVTQAREARTGAWYLPIDRVLTFHGHGTVVTGTLARGTVNVGDPVEIMPLGLKTKVRSLQVHGEASETAEPGQRTAMNLPGIETAQLERGHVAGQPGSVFATSCADLSLRWRMPPKHASRVRLSAGAEEVIGRIFLSDSDPNIAQIRTERPIALTKDQPVILRRYSPPDLLAGGTVAVPLAIARTKKSRVQASANSIEELLADEPAGLETGEILRRIGKSQQEAGGEFESLRAEGKIVGFAGLWFTSETFAAAAAHLLTALQSLHAERPTLATVPRELAVERAGLTWSGKPLDRIVSALAESGRIRANGTKIGHADHRPQLADRQRNLLDRVIAALIQAGVNVFGEKELAATLNVPGPAVVEIIKVGIEAGELVRLGEGLVYPQSLLDDLVRRVRTEFAGRRFAAAEVREALGTSRKYVIPLLEWMDARGVTLRQGDERVLA